MSDEWMPAFQLPLTRANFERLPRHSAFKYEWSAGTAWISPWPRHGHAQLRLGRFRADPAELGRAQVRPLQSEDEAALAPVFAEAFGHLQPYASLDDATLDKASTKAMRQTFRGGDGVLAPAASFVALSEGAIAGAILITLIPGGDPSDVTSMEWHEPPPPHLWENAQGQPHLTWIFVNRHTQGDGIGTLLLQHSVRALKRQGYKTLWTTFLVGNDSSLLWHWRNHFELLPSMFSKRRMRQELGR